MKKLIFNAKKDSYEGFVSHNGVLYQILAPYSKLGKCIRLIIVIVDFDGGSKTVENRAFNNIYDFIEVLETYGATI